MKPAPKNWSRLSVSIYYQEPRAAIDWLCRAFGFTVRLIIDAPDGGIAHSELEYGEAVLMVGASGTVSHRPGRSHCASPRTLHGANTQSACLYVDDADAHCAQALAAGATLDTELVTNDYGADYWTDRSYGVFDLEGHHWWFMQRLRG